jgi:hypothetical protein
MNFVVVLTQDSNTLAADDVRFRGKADMGWCIANVR